jgi:FMN phosphatase YigB (HAD superfamily)
VALRLVVFDVGETLIDETGTWERAAVVAGAGSSARWGVEKPAQAFFERVVEESGVEAAEVAYVGDRVDELEGALDV